MALSRKFLSAMGIETDKIDEIISAHSDTVNGLKEQVEKYKADAEKLSDVQKELEELKKTSGEGKSYKEKYEKEHAEFEKYKSDLAEKESKAKKENAYKELLKEAGISDKHINSVLKASDFSDIEFDDDGKVKGSKDIVKSIKDEWSDMIPTTKRVGTDTVNPPASNGGDDGIASRAAKSYNDWYSRRYGEVPGSNNNNSTSGGNE